MNRKHGDVLDLTELSSRLKEVLEKEDDVKLAILFGSYAVKRASLTSDVDLAVLCRGGLNLERKLDLIQQLSVRIGKDIDLVDLQEASGVLLQQILAHRVTIINRDGEAYGNIIAKRVMEEADYMPLYDQMLKERREKFIDG